MATLTRLLRLAAGTASALSPPTRAMSAVTSGTGPRVPTSLARAGLAVPLAFREPVERSVQWVFLGCPDVGKGTYASRLSRLLGVPHISTGDLVREQLSSSGPLAAQLAEIVNQGKLLPDEVIIDLLSKCLESGGAKGESGFILDGFPRTMRQEEFISFCEALELVPDEGDQNFFVCQVRFGSCTSFKGLADHNFPGYL